jgi:hypothetical protein
MPTPKQRHSKRRTKIRTRAVNARKPIAVIKTKDKKAVKRPHVDERIEV